MSETHEHRLKRMQMRSMRRGIKEMDIILSAYAQRNLPQMDGAQLDLYDALLDENDQDLYQWVTGQATGPDNLQNLINEISQTFQK
ncbi:succinate dehydrogenase assembly factor 2 [Parasedimentitalea huanghaiensis]|uniref:FAD assembly factor SdhE n=1 Tax=Parasedimentitalea huanghaiensis TaxID=2682100 RepID=A0A6L6WGV9_9RHOB|nr:succinate dehydrogenase assembly factor 2 [Zongyanglinia huanghaiensis]MVO16934.1 succinate dehydrogenase assembly factor 2 [Zongyanglinia huanghaiensis]